MPQRRRGSSVLAVLSALALCWLTVLPAAAEDVAFTFSDERVSASSGLAADPARGGYWTVNDSDDRGIAYAVDGNGDSTGTLEWQAEPTDVQGLALAGTTLYVGDIGDAEGSREFVTVFFFTDAGPDGQRQYRAYDFRYPDGARDAAALLTDANGRLFIVSKEKDGGIYAAPPQPSRDGVNDLTRVGDAPSYVTDGVVLADGRVALRTYVSVEVLDPNNGYATTARAALPDKTQGETIARDLSTGGLLVGTLGDKSKVVRIAVPDSVGDAPESPASPTPTAQPSPKPSADPSGNGDEKSDEDAKNDDTKSEQDKKADQESDTEGRGRQGTWVAIGVAVAVAAAAGAVVLLTGRRGTESPGPARAAPQIEDDPPEWDDWFTDED